MKKDKTKDSGQRCSACGGGGMLPGKGPNDDVMNTPCPECNDWAKHEAGSRAPSGRVHPLVILSERLRGIASMDPGVSKREAKRLAANAPDVLEEKLRDFVTWYQEHAKNTAQTLDNAIFAYDEDNASDQATRQGRAANTQYVE